VYNHAVTTATLTAGGIFSKIFQFFSPLFNQTAFF
jgi:hypothetical protein